MIYYYYGDNMKNKRTIIIVFLILVLVLLVIFLFPKKKEILIPKLVVSSSDIVIKIGDIYQINAYVENYPDAVLIWESSDNSIATVTNGTVHALDYGTVNIKITYNHTENDILTDNCTIKIISGNSNVGITSVSFLEGDLLLGMNKSYNINEIISIVPNDGLIESKNYSSSNTNILDINKEGVIKCLNIGSSIININFNDKYNDSIDVYCVDKDIFQELIVNPTNIEISDDKIKIGETKKINYVVTPQETDVRYISFSSEDSSIVSIDNDGYIKGLREGTTRIVATSINGLTFYANVTVEREKILAQSISVERDRIDLNVGDSYTLIPSVLPTNAENKSLSFETNSNVITLTKNSNQNSVIIKAVSSGSAVITIKTTNGIMRYVSVTVANKQTSSSSKNSIISLSEFSLTTPTIISTGNVNNSSMASPTDSGFDACKSVSPNLVLKINGTMVGQDGSVSVHVGQCFKVDVYLPTKCGKILTLTRTSPDGSDSWMQYFKQNDYPYVNRDDSSTYKSGVSKYTWTIAAMKAGTCTLSQTAQFDVLSPNGRKANIKSMIRLKVRAS